MASSATSSALAAQARRLYVEGLIKGMPGVVGAIGQTARHQLERPAEYHLVQRRRDLVHALNKQSRPWLDAMVVGLRRVLAQGGTLSRPADLPPPGSGLSLVDDDTIDREILTSRLALAMMDRASWEFTDLRTRVSVLEGRSELDTHDMLRAHVLARIVLDGWRAAGLGATMWRDAQASLHEEFAHLVEETYHEANHWLISQRVMPEVDLRPLIRRDRSAAPTGAGPTGGGSLPQAPAAAHGGTGMAPPSAAGLAPIQGDRGADSGSRPAAPGAVSGGATSRVSDHSEAVLARLNKLVGRQVPEFADTSLPPPKATPALNQAIDRAQLSLRLKLQPAAADGGPVITSPMLLQELQQRKNELKAAATTPVERATIEIVAMMFQSILTEEQIPAAIRVWFARLQMPVLRVAVAEPDFFATTDHPARRLIDRTGACVMGFESKTGPVDEALEKEIKRIVQVVEAYPDTGRRVFATVLTEFEKFLEHYFRNENEATKKGVSLAQQVEQRETLAIQYTIELRRMLNEVPVQEGVRQFLFQVWADVLATMAVRYGAQAEETRQMKRAAADLIWSAGAKVTRDERAEVIRRLPPLLKRLRDGMASAGMPASKQDEHIQALNNSLAAAFTAKAAVIPTERLEEMMERLETLEELLPDAADIEIDESMVSDLSGHESSDLEVVSEGGAAPNAAMKAWARELQVGSWYMLEYRNRTEAVQLVWRGLRKQLMLFATTQGRCVLFQQERLAAFLQGGLLLPAQEEALTVRATRSALAKLDADPERLTV
ncbi:MAG: DUF1631 family protein [Aquabacterium sp.]